VNAQVDAFPARITGSVLRLLGIVKLEKTLLIFDAMHVQCGVDN
jgi:hypothetical protein